MDWLKQAIAQAAESQSHEQAAPEFVPGRVLLVDADMICYSNAGNDETEPGIARLGALARLERLRERSGSEFIVCHLTADASNKGDRHVVATVKPYQANRSGGKRPKNWEYLRDWFLTYQGDLFKVRSWGDREADDAIALHATRLGVDKCCIATADKDMRMIPGHHIDWATYELIRLEDEFEIIGETGKIYGHKWFWLQLLQGDAADNIPGLPKYKEGGKLKLIGEKTAQKFLQDADSDAEACDIVVNLYRSFYEDGWADALAEQMSLLWMRRGADGAVHDFARGYLDFGEHRDEICQAAVRLRARVEEAKAKVAELDALEKLNG